MKKLICTTLLFTAMFTITACGNIRSVKSSDRQTGNNMALSNQTNDKSEKSTQSDSEIEANKEAQTETHITGKYILVTTEQENEIIFALNDSSVADSFYKQLPLTASIEIFGNNEKIFYPPEKLDTTNGIHNSGILNYYAPWGDVFMIYGTHNEIEQEVSGDVNGAYTLGDIVSGEEYIENLTGEIKIEKLTDEKTISSLDLDETESEKENTQMKVQIGESIFTAVLENNAATNALVEMMKNKPVVVQMSDYSGFEKVGVLGKSLPTNNSQITTKSGDIVLYQGNQIVIFYGSNSWSYTKLGKINDLTGFEKALGSEDVIVTFSLED